MAAGPIVSNKYLREISGCKSESKLRDWLVRNGVRIAVDMQGRTIAWAQDLEKLFNSSNDGWMPK